MVCNLREGLRSFTGGQMTLSQRTLLTRLESGHVTVLRPFTITP